jgi:hypothetical protein
VTTPPHVALRMTAVVPIVLILSAVSSSGCALAGRNWSRSLQLAPKTPRAAVIPGDWEHVAAQQLRSPLIVFLKSGDRVDGRFKALEPAVLALIDSNGGEVAVARSDVASIKGRGARDAVTNGALIGAGIGVGAALAILAMAGSGDGYVLPSAKWGAPLLLSGAGGIVGSLVDRGHTGERLLYVAP